MPIASNSDAAYFELLIDSATTEIDLGPLMYATGAWPDSIEIYVNGLLQAMIGQYSASSQRIILLESLEPGDTVRVVALPNFDEGNI